MRGELVEKTWRPDPARYASARYRRPCTYAAFIPERLAGFDLTLPAAVLGTVSDAEQAILRLNSGPSALLTPLARLLLRTESIASSKVEGMQIGVRELARAEAKVEAGGRASSTAREVMGNIEAMQIAVDEAASAERIGIGHLTTIHARLMAASPHPNIAGRLRTTQSWIGGNDHNPCGADFVPPPPEHVELLLEDLCEAVDDSSLPPLVQAALVHAQFETIHPFDDGNGRVGRALVHVVLRRRELAVSYVPPISVALAAERDRYIDGLTAYRMGDVALWIERFAGAAAHTARLASAYLDAVSRLMDVWRESLASNAAPRSDAAAWAVIDILPAFPVITTPRAIAVTGRAKSAIHQAIDQLVTSGVLEPLSGSKRNREWEAVGLLDLLEGLEAGVPPLGIG